MFVLLILQDDVQLGSKDLGANTLYFTTSAIVVVASYPSAITKTIKVKTFELITSFLQQRFGDRESRSFFIFGVRGWCVVK